MRVDILVVVNGVNHRGAVGRQGHNGFGDFLLAVGQSFQLNAGSAVGYIKTDYLYLAGQGTPGTRFGVLEFHYQGFGGPSAQGANFGIAG